MRISVTSSLLMVFAALAAPQARAQTGCKPWPKPQEAVVHANATWEAGLHIYWYELHSARTNTLPLSRLEIDLRHDPSKHPLAPTDLSLVHSIFEHFAVMKNAPQVRFIGIEIPSGWVSGDGAVWGARGLNEALMVRPGNSLKGFSIRAKEPPGIRDCTVDADSWDFVNRREGYCFEGTSDELIVEVSKGIKWLSHILAPVAPPDPFTVSSWISRMLSDVQKARKEDWIKTDEQLTKVKKLIEGLKVRKKRKLRSAVRKIERYVKKEVEAGRLTGEADALVRLNALYLLRRVKEDPKILKAK